MQLESAAGLYQTFCLMYDRVQGQKSYLSWELATWPQFSLGKWYAESCAANQNVEIPWEDTHEWMESREWHETTIAGNGSPKLI